MSSPLSLYELNNLVRGCIEHDLNGEYWMQAELSDVHTNSTGHCYLEFVQKEPRTGAMVARARGVVWAGVYRLLRPYFEESTGQPFCSGIKVQVLVTVSFHELYGYTLTVQDIDPSFTMGDLLRRRHDILKQLQADGVLTLNKELPLPLLPQRIAVVSSATAAGYGDFCHQLQASGYQFSTELFPALMQGDKVEDSVLEALDAIHARCEEFDAVVIIRGGGATSDLASFDTYLLAAACAQFPLPIITGIGHERDDTVLDAVAHTRVKTPTAAAEFLIGRMEEAAARLEQLARRLTEGVRQRLVQGHQRMERLAYRLGEGARTRLQGERVRLVACQTRLPASAYRYLSSGHLQIQTWRSGLLRAVEARLTQERHRLELVQQRLYDASPDRLLARGYSMTLKDGQLVKDAAQLRPGDEIVTRFARGEAKAKIIRMKNE